MIIKSLKLTNFRSFAKADFQFDKLTQIIGPNGVGKTNILEAIHLLSILKSFRAKNEDELIKIKEDYLLINGDFLDEEKNKKKLSLYLDRQKKAVKINDVSQRIIETIGVIPTVFFWAADIQLIAGQPRFRRRFMDMTISQYNQSYLYDLVELRRVLKQRNSLLARIKYQQAMPTGRQANESELAIWDESFIQISERIFQQRKKFFRQLETAVKQLAEKITADLKNLSIEPRLAETSEAILRLHLPRDLRLATTTYGPHHDDFQFFSAGRDLGLYGSRGQQKTAVILLKMAEKKVLENNLKNETAILLLDDIFSELDADHQEKVLAMGLAGQVIVTSIAKQPIEGKVIELCLNH